MTTTYNWNCKTVDAYPLIGEDPDVVYNVHWIVTGVSDQLDPQGNPYQARSIGTQALSTDDITDFIPFEDLTNEIVVEWTKGAMGEEEVVSIEASIQSQINSLITPASVTLTVGGEPEPPEPPVEEEPVEEEPVEVEPEEEI
tara:strand:- start:332 stop:757 length:426 start_codon:yes stop_codon:yes gene_type:complete